MGPDEPRHVYWKQLKSGQAGIVTGSEAEPQKLKHFRLHFWLRMTGKELCIFFCSTEILGREALPARVPENIFLLECLMA